MIDRHQPHQSLIRLPISNIARSVTRRIVVRRCCFATVVTAVSTRLSLCGRLMLSGHLGFHMFCLDPPLTSIPKEQWFCFTCLAGTGGDFGFDEGAEHTLSTFQARDLEFRRLWFESHPPPGSANRRDDDNNPTLSKVGNVIISEDDVENEFWRLVASPNETVEIEYGADVHSTTHGRYAHSSW